ncbi:MAG: RNA-directed DNA polymerase [Thermodesulfobacteriota bacterium]
MKNESKQKNKKGKGKISSKPKTFEQCMAFAIENVIRYGDTDIFPYPIERQVIKDKKDEIIVILKNINKSFEKSIREMPIEQEKLLQAVGYTGFRQGTQIDPIWNVYLLGLVILIGDDIEKVRLPESKNIVYSYRFNPDPNEHTIFSKDWGWVAFQRRAAELSQKSKFVLSCDISDFYPRVYHHRLENALKKATQNTTVVKRIKKILFNLSGGVSYGLPVGGPAARLLSELLLNRIDRLLAIRGILFCRFVDDYYIFTNTQEEAYSHLIYLCEMLLENEGLTLQKTKTRILSAAEFLETSIFAEENAPEDQEEVVRRNFLKIHIHYDRYSETAAEDYETLKKELTKFDIVGMLSAEMQKTRISESLTRKLVQAVAHIPPSTRDRAVISLIENLQVLYPIFPTVMIVIRGILSELSNDAKRLIFSKLRELINTGSYICSVPINLSYAIRVLSDDNSDETDATLIKVYNESTSMLIKRDIILILASHNADFWISAQIRRFSGCTLWEKRALTIASYILEDEGSYWRTHISSSLSQFDLLVMKWAGEKKSKKDPLILG